MKHLPSHCLPCEGDIPPLTKKESKELLAFIPHWLLKYPKIVRTFTFKDFAHALSFVNAVGKMAEKEGHHPDIEIHWNKVTLTLWTHAINGLSENDYISARKINELIHA
jgi:4a-hydroxytetrahydrobiopterin dehydratase